MLTAEQIQAIKQLINEAKQILDETLGVGLNLTDYRSFIEYLLLKELDRDINHLEFLLQNPYTFEDEFKNTCKERAKEPYDNGFNFCLYPGSQTNKLYWDIAHAVFESDESTSVLFPKLSSITLVQFDDKILTGQTLFETKQSLKNPSVKMISQPLPRLAFTDLTSYVITEDQFFDVRSVESLPFRVQQQVQSLLKQNHPELGCKLYSHNDSFKILESDLQLLEFKEQTPRQAIERLVKGLLQGGETATGAFEAQKPAQLAYYRFFDYFKTLPETVQNELNQLKGSESFVAILNELRHGECVETVSEDLTVVLQRNHKNPLLDTLFLINHDLIAAIYRKYKTDLPLFSTKGINHQMPKLLAQEAFRMIDVAYFDGWLSFLIHCPPEIYEDLFTCFDKESSDDFLEAVGQGIELDFFNTTQLNGLIKAIVAPNKLFTRIRERIDFAISCKSKKLLTRNF